MLSTDEEIKAHKDNSLASVIMAQSKFGAHPPKSPVLTIMGVAEKWPTLWMEPPLEVVIGGSGYRNHAAWEKSF
jgi:hypothetical protein